MSLVWQQFHSFLALESDLEESRAVESLPLFPDHVAQDFMPSLSRR